MAHPQPSIHARGGAPPPVPSAPQERQGRFGDDDACAPRRAAAFQGKNARAVSAVSGIAADMPGETVGIVAKQRQSRAAPCGPTHSAGHVSFDGIDLQQRGAGPGAHSAMVFQDPSMHEPAHHGQTEVKCKRCGATLARTASRTVARECPSNAQQSGGQCQAGMRARRPEHIATNRRSTMYDPGADVTPKRPRPTTRSHRP